MAIPEMLHVNWSAHKTGHMCFHCWSCS